MMGTDQIIGLWYWYVVGGIRNEKGGNQVLQKRKRLKTGFTCRDPFEKKPRRGSKKQFSCKDARSKGGGG